jgi:hypothetical protein
LKKVNQVYYEASAIPPSVREAWSTTEPLRLDPICEELFARGAHQTDIGDAIHEADRDWITKQIDEARRPV